MLKRSISLILACMMIFSLLPTSVSAAETVDEREPNNTKGTAQRIYHDNNVGGTLDGMFGADTMDFYTFVLGRTEMVRITAMSYNNNYGFRLDSADGYITGSESNGTYGGMYVEEIEMTLDAGTYYISVVGTSYSDFSYAIGLYAPSATTGVGGGFDEEDTLGFTIDNPCPVSVYQTFTYTPSENYYASFTAPADGYLTMYYYISSASSNLPNLRFTLYDLYGNKIWFHEETFYSWYWYSSCMVEIPLTAGDYTLCIQTDIYQGYYETDIATCALDYTYVEDCVVEQMPCDTKANATQIAAGNTAFGITEGYENGHDYWALSLDQDSKVQIIVDSDVINEIDIENSYGVSSTHSVYGRYYGDTMYTEEGLPYVMADMTAGTNYIKVRDEIGQYKFTAKLHTCEYEIWVQEEATCFSEGVALRECDVCQTSEEVSIPEVDHAWGEWTVDTYPTSTTEGIEERECTDCGEWETRPIEMLPIEFMDVAYDAWYAVPVYWAVDKGVTNGIAEGMFGPDQNCTRAQVVTFLWRAAGSPDPSNTSNPFKDVDASAWYGKAVLWAVEKGITNGMTANEFGTDQTCTRAQVATFLWRSQGKPEVASSESPFADVDSSAWYGKPVLWAVESGVTNGMGDGIFAPDGTCTRGQIVTFLYRAIAKF